jgi:hypothetical protein
MVNFTGSQTENNPALPEKVKWSKSYTVNGTAKTQVMIS